MYGRAWLLKYSLSLSAAAEIMPACRSAAVRLGASSAFVCVCEGEGAWGAHVFQTRTRSRQAGHRRIVERGAFNLRIWLFKKCIKGAKGRGRRDGEKETGQEAAQITANVNNVQPQTDTE